MSGESVIWYLLANNAGVLALVPKTKIQADELPLNTVLPAIEIRLVSGTPRTTIAMTEPGRLHTDRIQVSPLVKSPFGTPAGTGRVGVIAILKAILAACPNQRGTVNGVDVDSIVPDIEGPALSSMTDEIRSGSRDFVVKWREA